MSLVILLDALYDCLGHSNQALQFGGGTLIGGDLTNLVNGLTIGCMALQGEKEKVSFIALTTSSA